MDISWKLVLPIYMRTEQEKQSGQGSTAINDDFDNVIWKDKCSVQLQVHCRFCCCKGESKTKYVNVKLLLLL